MVSTKFLGFCLSLLTCCTTAQGNKKTPKQVVVDPTFTSLASDTPFTPLAQPQVLWNVQAGAILDNNGVYVSPDGDLVVSTAENGDLYAFDAATGETRWRYTPPNEAGSSVRCFSGVTFAYQNPGAPFMVYSVVDNPNSLEPDTRVIALSPTGEELWISLNLEGVAAGTPLVSSDGRFVYLTHNSNQITVGHFTVLDTESVEQGYVLPLYSEFNRTNPFAPPGIYHRPAEGYYDGGQYNSNDIVIWSYAPRPTDITASAGAAFVFQMPVSMGPDTAGIYWLLLGDAPKDWQATTPPVMTNQGRSLYWGVSRSQYRAWVGEVGRNQYRFNRGRTSSVNFDRGTPRFQSIYNPPTLSSDPVQPFVYGGTASTQFVKMDYMLNTLSIVTTGSVVKSQAKITPNDEYIYYTEFGGIFHMARTSDLTDHATVDTFSNLDGDFGMSPDGSVVYIGEISGQITALQVARMPSRPATNPPTLAPVAPPPTEAPVLETLPPEPEPEPEPEDEDDEDVDDYEDEDDVEDEDVVEEVVEEPIVEEVVETVPPVPITPRPTPARTPPPGVNGGGTAPTPTPIDLTPVSEIVDDSAAAAGLSWYYSCSMFVTVVVSWLFL